MSNNPNIYLNLYETTIFISILSEYCSCSKCTEIYDKRLYRFLLHTPMEDIREIIISCRSSRYFDRRNGFPGINQILPFRQSSYGRAFQRKTIWNQIKFPNRFQGKDHKS